MCARGVDAAFGSGGTQIGEQFARLAETCPGCGALVSGDTCGGCGRVIRVAVCAPGSLGALVRWRRGGEGIVVDFDRQSPELTVLTGQGVSRVKLGKLTWSRLVSQKPTSRIGAIRRAVGLVEDSELAAGVQQYLAEVAEDPDGRQVILSHVLSESPQRIADESAIRGASTQESAWWLLRAADVLGDSAGVLRWSGQLPTVGYEGRLLMWVRALARPDTDLEQLAELATGFSPESPTARLLRTNLLDEIATDPNLLPWRGMSPKDMGLLVRGLDGQWLPADRIDLLDRLDVSLVDDLIDAGAVPKDWAGFSSKFCDHLAVRLDPSKASIEALIRYGPSWELRARLAAMPQGQRNSTLELLDDKTAAQLRSSLDLASEDPDTALNAVSDLLADNPRLAEDLRRFREGGSVTRELLGNKHARDVLVRHADLDRIPAEVLDAASRERFARRHLRVSKDLLHDWDFAGAESSARTVLRITSKEKLRDEALNLIAVSRYLNGDAAGAVAALSKALEGGYTLALQTNLVVVAHGLGMDEEARVLAQLIREAPTQQLRVAAARRGLDAWMAQDDAPDLPGPLRAGLVSLLGSPLKEEDLIFLLHVLARFHESWLADRGNRGRVSPSARDAFDVFHARVSGDSEGLLRALAKAQSAEWAADMIDELARDLIETFREEEQIPAGFAMDLLTSQIRLKSELEIVITAGLLFEVTRIAVEEGEPVEAFIGMAEHARGRLNEADQESRGELRKMLDEGCDRLTVVYLKSRFEDLEHLIDGVNTIAQIPRYQINQREAQAFLNQVRNWSTETKNLVGRLKPITTDEGLLDGLKNLRSEAKRLRKHVDGMRI